MQQKINKTFGKSLDADIVLYLGLCNEAGWVKKYNGRTIVFLGIEKIMELNWCSIDDIISFDIDMVTKLYEEFVNL